MRAVVVLLMLMATGCAATPRGGTDPLANVPDDFSLEVIVLVGEDRAPQTQAHLRPGHYVLLPDGSLYAEWSYDADYEPRGRPGLRRTISHREAAELYSFLQRTGFADPAQASEPENERLLLPAAEGLLYVFNVTGGGDRWTYKVRTAADQSPGLAGVSLVRRVAELAWATDLPPDHIVVIPHRYNHGDDPYERYRNR